MKRRTHKDFWSNVDKTSDCWTWLGGRTKGNSGHYGCFQNKRAHRVAYESVHGPVAHGMVLDHLCRNTLCVNPDHLEPVTNRENILRGMSPSARAAKLTHCPAGHDYSTHGVIKRDGARRCRICHAAQTKAALIKYRARKRARAGCLAAGAANER